MAKAQKKAVIDSMDGRLNDEERNTAMDIINSLPQSEKQAMIDYLNNEDKREINGTATPKGWEFPWNKAARSVINNDPKAVKNLDALTLDIVARSSWMRFDENAFDDESMKLDKIANNKRFSKWLRLELKKRLRYYSERVETKPKKLDPIYKKKRFYVMVQKEEGDVMLDGFDADWVDSLSPNYSATLNDFDKHLSIFEVDEEDGLRHGSIMELVLDDNETNTIQQYKDVLSSPVTRGLNKISKASNSQKTNFKKLLG